MSSLIKNLDKPNTYRKWFDKIDNFSIFHLDDLFKLYDEYLNFLVEENKIKPNSSGWHQNKKENFIKSDYSHKKLANLTNYNNWPLGVETGLFKKDEYLKRISEKTFSGNFLFINIPYELFNLFHYLPNSDIGLIRYFVNFINKKDKWNDDNYINQKIEEIDELVPYWNHNFPIFIFKDILQNGLLMPLTNNHDLFLAGGIHRYVCQSLCKRPIPMFVNIPTKIFMNRFISFFINDDELLLPSHKFFNSPYGSVGLNNITLKINFKTQIVKFYLTGKLSREINDDYLEIGYCDYKTDTYQIYEF
jgi:hypothetical protein